jgi:putative cardiolipin synthase
MTNTVKTLVDVLLPVRYGQVLAALAWRAALLLMLLVLGACAGLPNNVERRASTARTDVDDTPLARLAEASTPADRRGWSGFRLLPDGGQAFDARLALVQQAAKTLDLQYYQLAHDRSGLQLLRALADAARRGVRVRLLVDDLYATGQDTVLAGLAARPGVEVRLFNPLPVRQGGLRTRVLLSLHEFGRINRRMHNKLFIADNRFAISGGRNIADEYFGRKGPAHFIDLDVLATGPVVADQSAAFDRYWNSPLAYPVESLLPAHFDAAAAARQFEQRLAAVPDAPAPADTDALGRHSASRQMAEGRLDLRFAPARVLVDAPDKSGADGGPAAAGAEDATVASQHAQLVAGAREEVIVASPYVVPDQRGWAAMKAALLNRVHVSLITNSLSTTDEPLVHAGYARHRPALLKLGVQLYELMPAVGAAEPVPSPEPVDASISPGRKASVRHAGSLGRLHAKVAVVDRRTLLIGSMNFDHRSARSNTEAGLAIDCPVLAAEAAQLLRHERLPASYALRWVEGEQRIEWMKSDADGRQVAHAREPHASPLRDLGLWLASQFVAEEWL